MKTAWPVQLLYVICKAIVIQMLYILNYFDQSLKIKAERLADALGLFYTFMFINYLTRNC